MRILFFEWKSLCQNEFAEELVRRGFTIDYYLFPREAENTRLNNELAEKLVREMAGKNYDFAFSFNYYPVISIACNACRVKYVSWTFDSPFIQLYSNTITFPYNYCFIFDKGTCVDLWNKGVKNVYWLPMAAPAKLYGNYEITDEMHRLYDTQVSFIGSTYREKKNQFFERLTGISEYAEGYLKGCMDAQKHIYGKFIMEEMLKPEIMQELVKACPFAVNQDGFERLEWVYAHYFLARNVTAVERQEILDIISEKYTTDLYTYEDTPYLPKVRNKGTAEVRQEAPRIYRCSKINLNISLRSILTGIPLRAFEIMGSRGFLLTNYQEDFLELFTPGEDFVYYEDYEDLMGKVDYYLSHEKERAQIAENGYEKVKTYHTYKERVDSMLQVLG